MSSTIDSYKKSFKKYGVNPRALKWHSEKAAKQRYAQIVADIDFENKSILDVGCGFGDIIGFISAKTKYFNYTGMDAVGDFIKEAKRRHPKQKFIIANFLGKPTSKKFDISIASGILNSNVKDNLNYRKKIIKKLFKSTKYALVFNMAGSHLQPRPKKTSNVWFADSLEITEYCLTLTSKIILRNHYHKRDFTIVMFK